MSLPLFSRLNLSEAELNNLQQLGFKQMTAIQESALPLALAGEDVIAQAQTGSGKTAAFGIPLLHKLNQRFFGVQGLVLCPTRELASQVAEELRKLARFQANIKIVVLTGGVGIGPQIASMRKGAHVVVGTPGRIKDHLRKQTLALDQLQTLVLDEADRMLDMGFYAEIEDIVAHTPSSRQTLLFSATYPENIQQLSQHLQRQPQVVQASLAAPAPAIQQLLVLCAGQQKREQLIAAISQLGISKAVVFCNTKQSVSDTTEALRQAGFLTLALHGDLEQQERDEIYVRFKHDSAHFLVATDVAARGLDVEDLPAVINFELPRDNEVYVHRIGRTGRAGKSGLALNLAYEKERTKVEAIEDFTQQTMQRHQLEENLPSNRIQATKPPMVTLALLAGKKDKLRAGDILGALTSKGGISGQQVGKIDVLNYVSYVAVAREVASQALKHLQQSRIKNRNIKSRRL